MSANLKLAEAADTFFAAPSIVNTGASSRLAQVAYVPMNEFDTFIGNARNPLAVIAYGIESAKIKSRGCPVINIPMPQLDETPMLEVWTSPSPATSGFDRGISYSMNGEALFGHISVEADTPLSLEESACEAYRSILILLRKLGYPHLLRMWNSLQSINSIDHGMERYKLFCVGRFKGFEELGARFEQMLPAASAVGSSPGGLSIHFLASTKPGTHLENPRQVSAYNYPPVYSPKSPSFSRGTYKNWGNEEHLYISGTASIVGHESVHIGDMIGQIDETMRNINAMLIHASEKTGTDFTSPDENSLLKVYCRNRGGVAITQKVLSEKYGLQSRPLYLLGDICRAELLLEMELICVKRGA